MGALESLAWRRFLRPADTMRRQCQHRHESMKWSLRLNRWRRTIASTVTTRLTESLHMRRLFHDDRCEFFEVRRFVLGAAISVTVYLLFLAV